MTALDRAAPAPGNTATGNTAPGNTVPGNTATGNTATGTPSPPSRSPSRDNASLAAVAVGAGAVGLFVAWVAQGGTGSGSEITIFLAAGPIGALFGLLAVTRFEAFVWAALLVRPSLDAVGATGAIGPGALLSSLFLFVATGWLIVQRRSGEWRPLGPTTKAMLAFAAAIALSVVTSEVRTVSMRALLETAAGISMFLVLEQLLWGRPDRLRRLTGAVLLSTIIPISIALRQFVTGTGMTEQSDVPRVYGTFVHPNPFATYLVLMVILGITAATLTSSWRRWALLAAVGIGALVIVVTYTRSAWIGLLVGVGYLGFRWSRWVLGALIVAVVAVVTFVPSVSDRVGDLSEDRSYLPEGVPRNSLEWRLQYWGELLPLAEASPVTGIGPQVVLATHPEQLEPHNVIVQAYVETGVLGLVALGGVIFAGSVELRRRRRTATTALERSHAHAAIAAGLTMVVLLPTENLLNQTMYWWYLAACTAWGFAITRSNDDRHPGGTGRRHSWVRPDVDDRTESERSRLRAAETDGADRTRGRS